MGMTEQELRDIQEGRLEFDKAPLAYQYEAGKDLLENADGIAQLPTTLRRLHEYYKIETGKKKQLMFRVRIPVEIFRYIEKK
jgi:hypothetical protein